MDREMIDLKSLIKNVKQARDHPELDLCRCSVCHTDFKVSECIHDYGHHDGWEMPAYTEIQCPDCDEGCIEDFWSSDKAVLEYGEYLQENDPERFDEYKTYYPDVYGEKNV
ncbi:hypothetical protein VPFG_00243 [Vibrio phage nt-1]|uniref:Uncharacterized protein n=1 Tax=Vibrio phage nt-1 TaxID=115992 RepID=R9TJH1_9CAUD|nr:hypothetical protein VPFG_00243 [Vibrio phage nt-1]AGN30242.2 hypothetical protein VPFG_00243 [Vibrio phage nt-1]